MRLPEWLIKAGARLEGDRLFFDEYEVEYKCPNIGEGEIPTLYQLRHYSPIGKEQKIGWSGFSCGLDLIEDKQLIWISGAYFDTFAGAFHHWKTSIRRDYEGTHMYVCEDHENLVRYATDECWCDLEGEECKCDPNEVAYRPSVIKLLG